MITDNKVHYEVYQDGVMVGIYTSRENAMVAAVKLHETSESVRVIRICAVKQEINLSTGGCI